MNLDHIPRNYRAWALLCATLSACALMANSASATCFQNSNPNLVENGGFENGAGTNIPHWKVEINNKADPYVYIDISNPDSGSKDLALGTTSGANEIVQHIAGTNVGQIYTVCLKLASSPNPSGGVTTFNVLWNNVNQLELTNSAQFDYGYYAFNVTASGDDYLRFLERNKQGYYYLDNVSVQLCSGCGLNPISKKD